MIYNINIDDILNISNEIFIGHTPTYNISFAETKKIDKSEAKRILLLCSDSILSDEFFFNLNTKYHRCDTFISLRRFNLKTYAMSIVFFSPQRTFLYYDRKTLGELSDMILQNNPQLLYHLNWSAELLREFHIETGINMSND